MRVAAEGSTARHVAATVAQIIVFWGFFLFLLPWLIHARAVAWGLAPTPFQGHRAAGVALFGLASTLGLGCGLLMAVRGRGTPLPLQAARRLVLVGPYRFVRNPMALAGISQGVGVGIFLADWCVIAYALAGAVVWHMGARPPEERDLIQRFGEPYLRYRDAVPLWWPRLHPYSPGTRR